MALTLSVSFANMPMIQGVPALTFVRLSGHEALGELFTYAIELKTPDDANIATGPSANLDLRGLLGQECSVTIDLDGAGTRETNGLIMKFDAGELLQVTCGESALIMDKKGNITLKGKDIIIEAAGEMGVKADKNITLKGQKIQEN